MWRIQETTEQFHKLLTVLPEIDPGS